MLISASCHDLSYIIDIVAAAAVAVASFVLQM